MCKLCLHLRLARTSPANLLELGRLGALETSGTFATLGTLAPLEKVGVEAWCSGNTLDTWDLWDI